MFAGWLPRQGGAQLRVLAGWFAVANVDELLRGMSGQEAAAQYRLGSLATAADRLATAGSPAGVRAVLAASRWGDPGGETPHVIGTALRLSWAERVAAAVPAARAWALSGAALLVARSLFVADRPLPDAAAASARRLLGAAAAEATRPSPVRRRPAAGRRGGLLRRPEPRGPVAGRGPVVVGGRVGRRRAAPPSDVHGPDPVIGTVATAAVDAWRVMAALECAARGGRALEVFDAVA